MTKLKIEMPHVGESVTEAVIVKWLVSPGDEIRKYDPLIEVVTDKVNMEVPAPMDGIIVGLLVGEGDTVQMGEAIAEMEFEEAYQAYRSGERITESKISSVPMASRIGAMVVGANVGPTGGEFTDTSFDVDQASVERRMIAPSTSSGVSRRGRDDRGTRISPVVRRLAERHNIDVDQITGTGAGGRVTKRDVESYLESIASGVASVIGHADEEFNPSPIRRMIADNMSRSFREIPHAWGAIEVDVTGMVAYRRANLERLEQTTGHRLTYLSIVLHHVARALREHSLLNSSWIDGKVVVKGAINIGVAVASKQGLVAPVIKEADGLSLEQTVLEVARIVDGARTGRLGLDDVHDGTFTLNNTGTLGSVLGGAIINYPQAAILTTEAIMKRPIVITSPGGSDAIAIRSMMNMCLSFDHRIIDGAEALAFMNNVKARLESISKDAAN